MSGDENFLRAQGNHCTRPCGGDREAGVCIRAGVLVAIGVVLWVVDKLALVSAERRRTHMDGEER